MKLKNTAINISALVTTSLLLSACGGDGKNGVDGENGTNGESGANALVVQSLLPAGDEQCFKGGLDIKSGIDIDADGSLSDSEIIDANTLCVESAINTAQNFVRIASFPVCQQIDEDCDTDVETAAEIVAVSSDGLSLLYSNSPKEELGFIDISDATNPQPKGSLSLNGEPTSVSVKDQYALVGVNSSENYINVAGSLAVIDIATQSTVRSIDLGGQPDSVAVSPDGNYALIAIENERDEDLDDGTPPQAPAGYVVIVDISDVDPANWTSTNVNLVGLADLYPNDPEPEFVDINADNMAVVTLQENNHLVLIDLATAAVSHHFSAGSVDLESIDLSDDSPAVIMPVESQEERLREPDGVSWINTDYFATANEGDLNGGSRGFSVFNTAGEVVWDSGSSLDHLAIRFGHYPDSRSDAKGNEPENIELGIFGDDRYLFVNSERSSLVFVYDVADAKKPKFKQVLPAAAGPEGGLAIPSRNLLVVASEEDSRSDLMRSSVNIYRYNYQAAAFPTIQSADREDGSPIPWSALSGLSADPLNEHLLYAVNDSYYASNRIFTLDISTTPAIITTELAIVDSDDVFANISTSGSAEDADSFDELDLATMINADKTVNIDPEGVAKASDGGYWIASEGAGTIGDTEARPIEKLNFVFKTDINGVIEKVITLPSSLNDMQVRFGFEGVAEYGNKIYVAFQRAWGDETNPRIGIYDTLAETWEFVFYPLDAVASVNGGWVGLSDITSLNNGEFLIIERDNQAGPDAAIKRLYSINLNTYADGDTLTKVLLRDLLPDLQAAGGLVAEKIEGSALTPKGDVYIVNDNDGVEDNSGETQLINLGAILAK